MTKKTQIPARRAAHLGRPALPDDQRMGGISVRFSDEQMRRIDAARANLFGPPTRGTFIRAVVMQALSDGRVGKR